jgi:hypothetical protein
MHFKVLGGKMKKIMVILITFIMLSESLFATGIGVEYCRDFSGENNEFLEFEIKENFLIYENFGIGVGFNFNSELKNKEIVFDENFEFSGGVSYKDILFYFKKDNLNFSPGLGIQKRSSLYKNFGIELMLPFLNYYYENNSIYYQEKNSITFIMEDQIILDNYDFSFFIKEEVELYKISSFKKNIEYEESIGNEIIISVRNKIGFNTGYFNVGVSNEIIINSEEKTKLDLKNTQLFVGFKF